MLQTGHKSVWGVLIKQLTSKQRFIFTNNEVELLTKFEKKLNVQGFQFREYHQWKLSSITLES